MFWETGWHAGTLISLIPWICWMHTQTLLFILHSPQQNSVADFFFLHVITGPTPPTPHSPHFLFEFFLNPTILIIARNCSNKTAEETEKLNSPPLPKMQPCTQKNKQWPSLSSVAQAILSRQPGLIFNLVDFLWNPPPLFFSFSFSYVCELHSQETLKLLRSQGTKTDWPAT